MKSSAHSHEPGSIAKAAAAWVLEEQRWLSQRQRARRDDWLAADPRHAKAYQAALGTLSVLHRHAAHPEIMALRQAALAHAQAQPASRRLVVQAACVVSIVLFGAMAWALINHFAAVRAPAYATSVGERSTVPLADGSVVTLNTASEVEVAYATDERTVRLLKGQAIFTVAHGQPAPFRVYAGNQIVTAIGTVFDVRIDDDEVRVVVIEGAVRVESRIDRPVPVDAERLVAGEALVTSTEGAMTVKQVDIARVTSWRSGLLSFQNTPLAEAVAEVNRYTQRPITLADPGLGEYRVSGTFRVGEPERFARAMTELFPVAVSSIDTGTVIKPQ